MGDLLQTALSIVAVAALAGLGLLRGTVTNLRENLNDARAEIADKDRRLTEAEKEIGRVRTNSNNKIQQLTTDLEALGRVVTGEAHWTAIADTLDTHHSEATVHWERDELLLTEIRDHLRGDDA